VQGPQTLGPVRLDLNTLVYACLTLLVGAQLMLLGGLAEVYGRQEGLVPERTLTRWSRMLRLETCVTAGLLLMGAGLAGTVAAVSDWGLGGFGDLDPRQTLRVVLPSATAIALGLIVVFSGLVGSLLTLRPTRSPSMAARRRPGARGGRRIGTRIY
jgi:hypothetical protein